MRLEGDSARLLYVEYEKGQAALFGDPGIDLAKGSGRAVPGISERLLAFLLSLLVDPCEGLSGHVDLASDLDIGNGLGKRSYDVLDHLGVHGDVFAFCDSVSACNGEFELTIFISECHGKTVDLRLNEELGFFAELLLH